VAATDLSWVLPGEPLPVRLMNTVRAERGTVHDHLQQPADLTAWLASAGVHPTGVTAADVQVARALRDALRTIAAHLTGDTRPAAAPPMDDLARAVEVVNGHRRSTPADHLVLADGTLRRETPPPGDDVADALAAVGAAAVDLFTGPAAQGLRACHGPRCVLYFVQDHPRREWCSPACGNRARAARHYRRHRDA
jgi:predicted RNA-binding Zn ribbon-like protein